MSKIVRATMRALAIRSNDRWYFWYVYHHI